MSCRKKSFWEFWRSKTERRAILQRANQLKLLPSQLKRLLGDSVVRTELQNTRTASLLPPVGTEVFRRFTAASLEGIQRRHEAEEEERDTRKKDKEAMEMDRHKLASDLEAGKPLPFIYGDPPPELLHTPLEELDPYYQSQKTFIMLSKWNIIHRFNAESSCYLLSPFNPLRTVAIKILIHSFFRMFILLTILTNCAFMMMSDPPTWTKNVEYVFVAVYTFDAIIKIVSRGFCVGRFTFLRDPWNWLDIMIISTAFLAQFVYFGKFSVLMMIPRVLKIITVTRGLKMTVGALIQSVQRLAGVFVLMAFCLSVFALLGLQLFMGSLKHKCFLSPRNLINNTSFFSDYYGNTTESDRNDHPYYLPGHHDALLCGNTSDAGVCPEGYVCMKMGKNPNYGYTNYDSIGWSLLALFRVMTGDWEHLALMTLRANGKIYLTFFVLVVFPGFFCILSLILVVVAMAISDQKEAVVAEARRKEEEFSQIVEALKRREEEEWAACRVAVSEKQDGENEKSHEQTNTATEDHRMCPPCCYIFADHILKWNCCGCWRYLKHRLYSFVMNPFFDLGIVICLIINTIFMAMEHFPLTAEFESHLSVAALVFTAIFVAEMVLKLVAMDLYGYFQVSWHIFDSILVAISLLHLSMEFNFLRLFLVMRVLRLARWWPSFHLLLKVMWAPVVIDLILLLLIVVFIFTMTGVQLFQKDYKENVCRIRQDCQLPYWNMTSFFNAFLIIFRVLCGEWIDDLLKCMEVSGQNMCLIFFVMVVVIGNLLVLNLFLNLLLSSFISDSLVAPNQEEKNNMQIAISWTKAWILEHLLGKKNHVKPDHTVGSMEDNRKDYLALDFVTSDQTMPEVKALSDNHDNLTSNYHNTESRGIPITTAEIKMEEEKKCDIVQTRGDDDRKGNTPEDCCCDQCYRCCPILDLDSSQGSGRFWSNFRRVCFTIVQHNYFEIFIIIIILLSSIVLVFEDIHLQHLHVLKGVVETANQVFTYLFLLEMLLKWFGLGLKKYFTSAWCWLDFIILDVFLVSLMADMLGFSGLRVFQFLRTLRALAPLRALSRFEGLRVVVQVLVRTVPAMFDGLLVFLLVWLMFNVIGVNLFAGKFFSCYNKTSKEVFHYDIVNNRSECLALMMANYTEVSWKNAKSNYDNVGNGYLSLLQLTVSKDWIYILNSAVNSKGVEIQPSYQSNPNVNLFFISFLIISSFFTFNFFIRVIISDLQRHKRGKHPFMTEAQQKYSWSLRKLFSKKPNEGVPRPQNEFQARLFDLVTSWCFEVFMVVVICLNMVILMVETEDQSEQKDEILHWFHFVIFVIFFIEFILKIIALRKFYFSDCCNILDFLVIFVSIIGVFLEDLLSKYFVSPASFSVLRLVRIGRVLHLIHCTRGIRELFLSFMMSLPAVFNISLLLFLLLFTFSLFGMFNFAYVKKEDMIDDMFNFETFGNSMICLLMISISAGFHSPIMNTPPDCDLDIENPGLAVRGNCGSPLVGIIFFTTFIVLSYLLVIHLYIAVILQTFNSEDTVELCDDEVQMFCKTWSKFDPDASQFIQYSKLSDLCDALQDPLRIPKPNTIKLIHMDLPLFPGDKIHCADVLLALATQGLDDSRDIGPLKAKMEEKFKTNLSKVPCKPISSTLRRKQEEVAATVIQRAYRKGRDTNEMAVLSVDGDGGVSDVSGSSKSGGASE